MLASASHRGGLHHVTVGQMSKARRDLNLAGRLAAEHMLGNPKRRASRLPRRCTTPS